mgnify:CR=1 FL=1
MLSRSTWEASHPAERPGRALTHHHVRRDLGALAHHDALAADADVVAGGDTSAQVGGLTNGVAYVCRAFASNDGGMSEASPLSRSRRGRAMTVRRSTGSS